jgi:hypothetical protein
LAVGSIRSGSVALLCQVCAVTCKHHAQCAVAYAAGNKVVLRAAVCRMYGMSCSGCGRICFASATANGVGLLPYSFPAHSYLSLVWPVSLAVQAPCMFSTYVSFVRCVVGVGAC